MLSGSDMEVRPRHGVIVRFVCLLGFVSLIGCASVVDGGARGGTDGGPQADVPSSTENVEPDVIEDMRTDSPIALDGQVPHDVGDRDAGPDGAHDVQPVTDGATCDAMACDRVEGIRAGGPIAFLFQSGRPVRVWGDNVYGMFGNGTMGTTAVTSPPVTGPMLGELRDLVVGDSLVCALTLRGEVFCWGTSGVLGSLGNGQSEGTVSLPMRVAFPRTVTRLWGGGQSFCVLQDDGRIACWGAGVGGRGDRLTRPEYIPQRVEVAVIPRGAYAGSECIGDSQGVVWCWGNNNGAELGDGTMTTRFDPQPVEGLRDVVKISRSRTFVCALRRDRALFCWGAGRYLPGATSDYVTRPMQVMGIPPLVETCHGFSNTCGLTAEGATWCWGDNAFGEAGQRPRRVVPPAVVEGVPAARQVACGSRSTCILGTNDEVWCWGAGQPGPWRVTLN